MSLPTNNDAAAGDNFSPIDTDRPAPQSLHSDSMLSPSNADEVSISSHWSEAHSSLDSYEAAAHNEHASGPPRRRRWLPMVLFLLTMLSTFVAGATGWVPFEFILGDDPVAFRKTLLLHWDSGLVYMASLLAILMAHEMGHFLMTLYYGIPASFPYFLPFPLSPIGTFGAVIRMDNRDADRKQLFDIGIAGPLAGLVVAVPLLFLGVQQLDLSVAGGGSFHLGIPLGLQLLLQQQLPQGHDLLAGPYGTVAIDIAHVNPYFMAGWVGLLVTALNMIPVSQLDGGHITYTLFGKPWAHWIARTYMVLVIATMVALQLYPMVLMIGIIMLIGIDHPPTSNDQAPIGWFRYTLGLLSLSIPILCTTLSPIIQT